MPEKGELIVAGYVDEVMRKARRRILLNIRVGADTDRAAGLLEQHDLVEGVSIDSSELLEVTLTAEVEDYSDLPTVLIEAGFKLSLFREEEVNLETAFMELTKGLVQ